MFGIGFTELLLISIVAILFLGPDKLPQALVDMAKFIKKIKITVGDAKSSLEEELKIADLKEEALKYKQQLDTATDELRNFKNINFDDFKEVSYDNESSPKALPKDPYAQAPNNLPKPSEEALVTTPVEAKNETVTFQKKPKIEDKTETTKEEIKEVKNV